MTTLQSWSDFAIRLEGMPPLRYVYGARHSVDRGDHCRAHSHSSVEIVFHPTGQGVTRLDEERSFTFCERSAVIYAPNELHDQEMSCDGEDMCVQLSVANVPGALPVAGFYIPQIDDSVLMEEIRALTKRSLQLNSGEQAIYNLRATAVLLALIRVACAKDVRQSASLAEQRVLQAEEYIREHFSTMTSLSEVSDNVGISPDFLRHTFKQLRAKSIVRYLNEVRIDRAKDLLTHSKLSLKQIAPICGFNNEYYLSSVFRQLVGDCAGSVPPRSFCEKVSPGYHRPKRSANVTLDPFLERSVKAAPNGFNLPVS